MNYLFVDIGTYSVKFLKTKIDHGKIIPLSIQSSLILEAMKKFKDISSIEDIQIHLIKDYLKSGFEGKIIYQLPNEYITSRFIQLPVTNKNKANMMIPFQLDEQLPFPISTSHYAVSFRKYPDHFKSMICVSKISEFETYYNKLKNENILPNVLTTELACINNFVSTSEITYPYAILDIGHTTTKVYMIQNGVVVSNHVSYFGGKIIDLFISKTYNLSGMEEVLPYKHNHCFFLTENQFKTVDQPQKEFGYLIKQVIWPLITDIKRWELGHRTKYEEKIKKYFIIGGTSNIKNISHFLTQALTSQVGHLSIVDHYTNFPTKISNDEASYSLITIMTSLERTRKLPFNMLHGQFSTSSMNEIPLYSTAFIAIRALIIGFFLSAFFIVERVFFLSNNITSIDREILNKLRTPALKISQTQRASYRSNFDRILQILKGKNKQITQTISTTMASSKINALFPLINFNKTINNNDNIELIEFYSNNDTARAKLRFQNESILEETKTIIEKSSLKNIKIDRTEFTLLVNFDK